MLRAFLTLYRHLSVPYVRRRPGRVLVLVLCVSIGVAAIVATGTLVESTLASLEATWRATAPSADLRIGNGFVGVDEEMIESVRGVEGVAAAGAFLKATARMQLDGGTHDLLVVGVDLLADDPVHQETFSRESIDARDEMDFLTRTDAVALPRDFAELHGLPLGSTFEADVRTGRRRLYVAGLFEPSRATSLPGGAVALMDLPVAQRMLGREGMVEAIDVRLGPGADLAAVRNRLAHAAAGRATVVATAAGASQELRGLLFNPRLVLGVAGGLVMVVGGLVIFNAAALMISQRKPQLDVVRSLGVSRRSLLGLLSAEAIALGSLGAAAGVALGAVLAWAGATLLSPAIDALYTPLASWSFRLAWRYVGIRASFGVLLTWLATVAPALSATRLSSGLAVASPRRERWRRARRLAWAGLPALLAGALCLRPDQPGLGAETIASLVTAGSLLVLLGLGLVAPVAVIACSPLVEPRLRSLRALSPRLGWLGLISDPGRSAVVITSIMIGVAYAHIALGVVGSLREGIRDWITRTQQADLVVTAHGSLGFLPSAPSIPGRLEERIRRRADVAEVAAIRLVAQPYEDRWVVIAARDPDGPDASFLANVSGDLESARSQLAKGDAVVASEHFAVKHGIAAGDTIELRTPTGPARFRVADIAVDYSGDLGTVIVSLPTFRKRWRDQGVTAFYVWLRDGIDPRAAQAALWSELVGEFGVAVTTLEDFRGRAGDAIDAVFSIGYAMVFVAVVVLVASVVSFFLLSLIERGREIELLHSVGAARRQIRGSFLWEAGFIGLIGGVLGAAAGAALLHAIVTGAIRAGGGMVLDVFLPMETLLLSIAGALVVSVLAALGPVWNATGAALAPARSKLDQ